MPCSLQHACMTAKTVHDAVAYRTLDLNWCSLSQAILISVWPRPTRWIRTFLVLSHDPIQPAEPETCIARPEHTILQLNGTALGTWRCVVSTLLCLDSPVPALNVQGISVAKLPS